MTVDWLAGPLGQLAIEQLRGVDPLRARQVVPGLSGDQVSAALTQAKHRPPDFPLPLVTETGIQQATAVPVALRRAQRLAAAGVTRIIDAGCGIGVDAWAFQQAGLQVIAYEIDAHTAHVARANLGDGVEVVHADVTAAALPAGALYVDPARRREHLRTDGRPVRIHDPEQWSPPWGWVLEQARRRQVVARVRPGMRELPAGAEWQCTSMGRSLVDATLWFAALAHTDRSADVYDGTDWHHLAGPAVPVVEGPVRRHIVDPDPAIVRAGLVTNAAELAGGHLLDRHLAFITCEQPPPRWLGRAMEVLEPVDRRSAGKALRRHGMTGVTVWARGFNRQPLNRLPEGRDGVIVAARLGDSRTTAMWLGRTTPDETLGADST